MKYVYDVPTNNNKNNNNTVFLRKGRDLNKWESSTMFTD